MKVILIFMILSVPDEGYSNLYDFERTWWRLFSDVACNILFITKLKWLLNFLSNCNFRICYDVTGHQMVVKYQPVLVTDLFIYGTQLHGEFYTNYQDMLDQLTRSIFIQTNQSVCRFFKIKLVWRNVKYTNFVISVM